MTTAAERLVELSGSTGSSAVLLLLIGSGVTPAEALVDYSRLPTGTAEERLMVQRSYAVGWITTARRRLRR